MHARRPAALALTTVLALTTLAAGLSAQEVLYPVTYREYGIGGEQVDYRSGGFDTNTGYGFIDADGELVVEPLFEEVGPFSEGLAPVKVPSEYFRFHRDEYSDDQLREWGYLDSYDRLRGGGRWGYVDTAGELVIAPRFHAAAPFSNGIAEIRFRTEGDRRWDPLRAGFIGTDGQLRFELEEDVRLVAPFREGVAPVRHEFRTNRYEYGVIDTSGELVVDFRDLPIGPFVFREGLVPVAPAGIAEYREWGFMDANGELVIEPAYLMPQQSFAGNTTGPWEGYGFSGGLAAVGQWTDDRSVVEWYYIDRDNEKVLGPYAYAYTFSEGLAQVRLLDGRRVFIDTTGAVRFEIDTDSIDKAGYFRSGRVRVYTVDYENSTSPFGDRVYGFLDTTGEAVVPVGLEDARDYRGELARVADGYIDRDGAYFWREE